MRGKKDWTNMNMPDLCKKFAVNISNSLKSAFWENYSET